MKTTITIQSPSPHLWGHGFHVVNFWIGRCISLAGTQVTTTVHLRSTACEVDLLQQFSTVETEYRKQLVLIFFVDGVNQRCFENRLGFFGYRDSAGAHTYAAQYSVDAIDTFNIGTAIAELKFYEVHLCFSYRESESCGCVAGLHKTGKAGYLLIWVALFSTSGVPMP
ncbi:hypothetical protein D3C80_1162790 [compost metagenome]